MSFNYTNNPADNANSDEPRSPLRETYVSYSSDSSYSVNQMASDLLELNRITNQGASTHANQPSSSNGSRRVSASANANSSYGIQGSSFQAQYNPGIYASTQSGSSAAYAYNSGANAAASATNSRRSSGAHTNVSRKNSAPFLSNIEAAILRSINPIEIDETEEITVLGQRGVWVNKSEVINWRGVVPIEQYLINEDSNPEIITKHSTHNVEYIQELAIRYLRPPTPPPPGDIIITQEANKHTPPAPPLIIRQQPPRVPTPEPLVVREAPPNPPAPVGRKVITVSGKKLPPPPRKVVIERLAPLPTKPQSVIIERWLPYQSAKRKVIFQKPAEREPEFVKPRNVIVQWEMPDVTVKKEVKYLGVVRANPAEYVERYGTSLKRSNELPGFVLDIKPPEGIVLAADYKYKNIYELEGDVAALNLVDLEREGLAEYRSYLKSYGRKMSGGSSNYAPNGASATFQPSVAKSGSRLSDAFAETNSDTNISNISMAYLSADNGSGAVYSSSSSYLSDAVINEIFNQLDRNRNGKISVQEAEKVLLRLNSRLGRDYGEDEVKAFFIALDRNGDGFIDIDEFRVAFERLNF